MRPSHSMLLVGALALFGACDDVRAIELPDTGETGDTGDTGDPAQVPPAPAPSCKPERLADPSLPTGLAVDEHGVYWIDALEDTVSFLPRLDSGSKDAPRVVATEVAHTLTQDDGFLYYVGNDDAVHRLSKDADWDVPLAQLDADYVYDLTAAGDWVYWGARTGAWGETPEHHVLARVRTAGGYVERLVEVDRAIRGMRVDSDTLFWADAGPYPDGDDGSIQRLRLDDPSAEPDVVVADVPHVLMCALGPTHVYFGAVQLWRVSRDGGEPERAHDTLAACGAIVHEERMYAGDWDGRVYWFPTTGGTRHLIHDADYLHVNDFAIHDGYFYFTLGPDADHPVPDNGVWRVGLDCPR